MRSVVIAAARRRFWFAAMDVAFCIDRMAMRARGVTSKLYLLTVAKASDAEWSGYVPDDDARDDVEAPW